MSKNNNNEKKYQAYGHNLGYDPRELNFGAEIEERKKIKAKLDLDAKTKKFELKYNPDEGKLENKNLDDSDIYSESERKSQIDLNNINPDINDSSYPNINSADISSSDSSDIRLIDKTNLKEDLDSTKPDDDTINDKINFKTKPSLKDLPGIGQKASGFWPGVKRGAMGGLRILLIPAATSIIFGCGLFVVLAFLFKVPAAAILEKIGFKHAAKELISGKEVELAQEVALTVFDFVYGGTARDFGAHGRGLSELSRNFDTIKEECVDKTKKIESTKNKENQTEPNSELKPNSEPKPNIAIELSEVNIGGKKDSQKIIGNVIG